MTMPTTLCPNRMQVHSVYQETPDVWTINLINHDFYTYDPGQFALVSIENSGDTLRAYTLSSSPGLSPFITITVRRLDNGMGSNWLTQSVKPGDYLWLSDAQGEFSCANIAHDNYLMLAAGCGVTPIMSMVRWLLANNPSANIKVLFNVRDEQQVIFSREWQYLLGQYPQQLQLCIMQESPDQGEITQGRLTQQKLAALVPDIQSRVVMTCGPAAYMQNVQNFATELGVDAANFFMERFSTEPLLSETTLTEYKPSDAGKSAENTQTVMLKVRHQLTDYSVPVGMSLLAAMELNKLPVVAACRAGVCGSCKTQVITGDYTQSSQMTLTAEEIEQGYVLACSCQLRGNIEIA